MFRQLTAVAQVALNYPNAYKTVVGTIAARSTKADFDLLIGKINPSSAQQAQDSLRRVREQSNQDIAGLQLALVAQWKRIMQAMSFLVSLGLAYAALHLAHGSIRSPFGLGITSILAAFLAPVARDLVAALEKARS